METGHKTAGQLLREARLGRGVSQRRLAIRAGTTQSAISRIEKDHVSPSVNTLRELLHMLGEDLVLDARQRDYGIDRTQVVQRLREPLDQRIEQGLEFAAAALDTRRANAT